jgi:hypothetical protein
LRVARSAKGSWSRKHSRPWISSTLLPIGVPVEHQLQSIPSALLTRSPATAHPPSQRPGLPRGIPSVLHPRPHATTGSSRSALQSGSCDSPASHHHIMSGQVRRISTTARAKQELSAPSAPLFLHGYYCITGESRESVPASPPASHRR